MKPAAAAHLEKATEITGLRVFLTSAAWVQKIHVSRPRSLGKIFVRFWQTAGL